MNSKKNTNKTRKIGLLGGSFNPPHSGHVHISDTIYKKLGLNEIWWIVSPQNPLKQKSLTSHFNTRIVESERILNNKPYIKVKSIEKQLGKYSKKFYTYNFIIKLKKLYPKYEFYFIIGADNLINFHKWYKWQKLLDLVNFIAIDRGGVSKYKALNSKAYKTGKIKFINSKKIDISSTEIRENSANL